LNHGVLRLVPVQVGMAQPLKSCLRKPGEARTKNPNPIRFNDKISFITLSNKIIIGDLPSSDVVKKKYSSDEDISSDSEKIDISLDIESIIGKSVFDSSSSDDSEPKSKSKSPVNRTESLDSSPKVTLAKKPTKKAEKPEKTEKNKQHKSVAHKLKLNKGKSKSKSEAQEPSTLISPRDMESLDKLLHEGIGSVKILKPEGPVETIKVKYSFKSLGILVCYTIQDSGAYLFLDSYTIRNSAGLESVPKLQSECSDPNLALLYQVSTSSNDESIEEFSLLLEFEDKTERDKLHSVVDKVLTQKRNTDRSKRNLASLRQVSAKNVKKILRGNKPAPFPGVRFHDPGADRPMSEKEKKKKASKKEKSVPFPGIAHHTAPDEEASPTSKKKKRIGKKSKKLDTKFVDTITVTLSDNMDDSDSV
jgi:hypothetical protein